MILVSFLEKFNINILAAYYLLKPDQLIIVDNEMFPLQKKALKSYFSHDRLSFVKEVSQVDGDNVVWNVSGDSSMAKYEVFSKYVDSGKLLYFSEDLKEGFQYVYGEKKIIDVSEIYLNVQDFIESMGGEILHEATDIYEDRDIQKLLSWQVENYRIWRSLKSYLRRPGVLKFSATNDKFVQIKKTNSKGLSKAIGHLISELQKYKTVKVIKETKGFYMMNIGNYHLKNYLAVSGAWLEALTYKTLKDIETIDSVNGGVSFLWNTKDDVVRNEMDVMAVNDLRLFSISCKDTSKYNEWTLNELETYGDLVGGTKSVKLLVTTSLPQKEIIVNRCNEMGIELVLFDGDIKGFKIKLEEIINDYS